MSGEFSRLKAEVTVGTATGRWHRWAWPIAMAVLCAVVLATRVYVDFDRVRVRLVTEPRPAEVASMTIPVGYHPRLAGRPVAVILGIYGDEDGAVSIALDGATIATAEVPANQEVRIDTAVEAFPPDGRALTITSTTPGWTLTYLELSTAHGYSGGLLEVLFVPDATRGSRMPSWLLFLLLAALAARPPDPSWPRGWARYAYRLLAGLVLLVFGVALVAPWLTRFSVLLSVPAFVFGLVVLYAEPIVRTYRSSRRAFVEGLHARDLDAVPGCREVRRENALGKAPIPRWITALDLVCLVVFALMVRAMVGDGYRITVMPGIEISLRSWWRVGLWLAGLLAIRHALWRRVGWHSRVTCWAWSAVRWLPARAVWPPYAISRLMVLAAGYVAVNTVGFGDGRPFRALQNDVLDLFARWDAGWYFGIASNGYESHFNPERMNAIAFFPGLPLTMRVTGVVLDTDLWIAGILVVTLAFFLGLTYVYRLALEEGLPADQARAGIMFLAFYPFAVCYSAILTESLFLLAAAATFFYFRRGVDRAGLKSSSAELWKAGAFGVFVGLLRPNGFLLAVPLGLLALMPFARSRGWLAGRELVPRTGWAMLAVQLAVAALPVAGMIAYAAHANAVVGRPFAFVEAQEAWGRESFGGFTTLEARWDMIQTQGFAAYARIYTVEMVEAAAAFFALAAVWPISRRFGLAYGVFVAMAVLPPLITMGSVSLGRYTAPLFPIFFWLGAAVPERQRPYWLAVFAAGQALVAALFFTWRAPY